MTNQDKRLLAYWVKMGIDLRWSKTKTIIKVSQLGFKRRTVGVYYDTFKEKPPTTPALLS